MLSFLLFVVGVVSGYNDAYLYLNGDDWMLTNKSMTKPIKATVPGQVYYPLINANVLKDPFYGNQPMEGQDLAR